MQEEEKHPQDIQGKKMLAKNFVTGQTAQCNGTHIYRHAKAFKLKTKKVKSNFIILSSPSN